MMTPSGDRVEQHCKRVRHHEDGDLRERIRTTDCYDEVTECEIREDSDGRLWQSWLTNQEWFSQHQLTPGEMDRSSEIHALERQLLEVKRRLWPAAEDASEAYNARIKMTGQPEVSASQIFTKARRLCDPMEVLGEGRAGGLNKLFVNRSAVKLANLNASVGFVLTQVADADSFHFVDLCAAPGGFSEYIFHHCGQRMSATSMIRGFGMSLVGSNEHGKGLAWKVDNYDAPQMQYRICAGKDGTGDIYNWDNTLALVRDINKTPIHAVLCDGGVDAQRDHEDQEALVQKLVVCQAATALSVLAPGGSIVLKLFGCQTDAVRAMMKDLVHRFEDLLFIKPISSRPASAERYLVLVGYQGIPQGFDGRKWLDATFLGAIPSNPLDVKVESYLDKVDASMLKLNLKACFAILSKLERMARHLEEMEVRPQENLIDVGAYRRAWKL